MATSAPEIKQPVTFPARLQWLQHQVKHHVHPYHVVVAGALGLATVVFGAVILIIILVATNFNLLGWTE